MGDRHLWIAGQHQKAGALHTVHQLLALDAEDLVVQFGLAILNGDSHVHQPLLGDGVGHIELQHDVAVQYVFCARHHVLCFTLSELDWRTRSEHAPKFA